MESIQGEKLQKILANRGLGSRRGMEKKISDGAVKVNGAQAKLGDRALDSDRIEIDGKLVPAKLDSVRVILYNKPEGQICTRHDDRGRETVFQSLPKLKNQRWINVGRLDINTSGLLLFVTDGELANRLMHPSSEVDREYLVRVFGQVTDQSLDNMREGVMLDDGLARFTDISLGEQDNGANKWFTVCLKEGRNREVRRLWESQDLQVNRLKRVRYGPIFLPSFVKPGQWLDLEKQDINLLYRACGLDSKKAAVATPTEKIRARRREDKLRARGRRSR